MWTQIRLLLQEQSYLVPLCYKAFQQTTKADDYYCNWRFKGLNDYIFSTDNEITVIHYGDL